MKIKFSKMHGLGNDFVVIDNREVQHNFHADEIKFLADRRFGVGCDQVLLIDCVQISHMGADYVYRIYNADGSEAGQCGNGARCVVKYLSEYVINSKSEIKLLVNNKIINGKYISSEQVVVSMGYPSFNPQDVGLDREEQVVYSCQIGYDIIDFGIVSVGNPHAIIELTAEQLANFEYMENIATTLQQSSMFANSVNVNFVQISAKNKLNLITYERGAGFTLACGSGACASAAYLIKNQRVDNELIVSMRGGELKINYVVGEELYMTGPAAHVFDGVVELI